MKYFWFSFVIYFHQCLVNSENIVQLLNQSSYPGEWMYNGDDVILKGI